MAAQQAAGEHAVRRQADAQLPQRRDDRLLRAAREQRVLDLQVADGSHGGGAPDGVGAQLRQPDVPDVTGLAHLLQRADGLLHRDLRVEAARAVDVDVVGLQAPQRVGESVLHGLRRHVVGDRLETAVGSAARAELDAQDDVLAPSFAQGTRDEHLVRARAVEVSGVDEVQARVDRRVQGRDALRVVGRTVQVGHAHGAQADGGNLRARQAQLAPSDSHDGSPCARNGVWEGWCLRGACAARCVFPYRRTGRIRTAGGRGTVRTTGGRGTVRFTGGRAGR